MRESRSERRAPEPGKDAFHRVPLLRSDVRDAVERVLTCSRRLRPCEPAHGPRVGRLGRARCSRRTSDSVQPRLRGNSPANPEAAWLVQAAASAPQLRWLRACPADQAAIGCSPVKGTESGAVTKQRRNCSPLLRSRSKALASNRQQYENLEFPKQRPTGGSRYVGRCVSPGDRLCGRPCHVCATALSSYSSGA